jgi:uncharacterized iron-regulated membrane protein
MKKRDLNQWLWKWHFIAGIICLPFIAILAITGGIYLFKDNYEAPKQAHIKTVKQTGNTYSYASQYEVAKNNSKKPLNEVIVSKTKDESTEFVSGRFGHKNSLFINPYTNNVQGEISPNDSKMHTVRKLHGELLLGKFGTKIVELVASWMLVLILTGLYIFWPSKKEGIKAFFRIRYNQGKRLFYRDLHALLGFWMSVLLLMTLAGGFPWTDVFGSNFKWFQGITNTGFPDGYDGRGFSSTLTNNQALSIDDMVKKAEDLNLEGVVSVVFPKGKDGVYSIYNSTFNLEAQQKFHFDQYSGKQLKAYKWSDVGILMRARMWFMAFHQGQFGKTNFAIMLFVAISLFIISLAGFLSYLKRKPKGKIGVPKVSKKFKVGYGVIGAILILSILFPLFGASILLIILGEYLFKFKKA